MIFPSVGLGICLCLNRTWQPRQKLHSPPCDRLPTSMKRLFARFHSVPCSGLLRICGSLFCGAGFRTKRAQELSGGQGIDDVVLFQPASARHGYAILDERKVPGAMGVGGNNDLDAAFLAHPKVDVIEVQAVWVGV